MNHYKKGENDMANQPTPTKCITPEFRASYAKVLLPGKTLNDEEKYSISMVFPKGTDLTEMKAAAAQALINKFGKKENWPKNLKSPFRDGNEKDDPNYEDCIFVNASSYEKPQIIDRQGNRLTESSDVYSGMWAKASVNAFYFDKKGNKGVAFGLNNLLKWKDDERLDGRSDAEDDFADYTEKPSVEDGGVSDEAKESTSLFD
jgi:hypothetical protein